MKMEVQIESSEKIKRNNEVCMWWRRRVEQPACGVEPRQKSWACEGKWP